MKNLKSILLVIAVMAACVSFTSCDDDESQDYVGSWEYVDNVTSTTYTYIIKDDGTYVFAQGSTTEMGIYTYDAPSIVFVGSGTAKGAGIGTLSGRAIQIDNQAQDGIYIKK